MMSIYYHKFSLTAFDPLKLYLNVCPTGATSEPSPGSPKNADGNY
jgi:hypothetical protein